MKICILTERMKVGFGVDLVVDEQARQLADRGHEVHVVVAHADLDQPPRPYSLVVLNRIAFRPDYGDEHAMRKLLDRCKLSDTDIWIVHTAPFYEWIRWLNGPVLAVEHGTPSGHFFSAELGRSIDDYAKYRVQDLYAHLQDFDGIVSISNWVHNWLPAHLRDLSRVIYNGGDHYRCVDATEIADFRKRYGFDKHEKIALWLGRMQLNGDEQPYKNFKRVRSVARKLKTMVPESTFVLAGRVSAADAEEIKKEGFSLLPNLPADELAVALAACDVFVNLSLWEGFNLALVEAQFVGTPVVGYRIGPHPEVVLDRRSGMLSSTENDLVANLARLLTNDELRMDMADNAKAFAAKFTWSQNVDQLLDCNRFERPTFNTDSGSRIMAVC